MKVPKKKGRPKLPPKPPGGGAAARRAQFELERGLKPPTGASRRGVASAGEDEKTRKRG
jgi:hypothetical protein